ncbi:hypothetical protein LDG_8821 [Legionella drancourtii LLAP12]|uniref:Uncharacterized protein n=1 Tax=Legionella drancourtii LLAP12 TaxID=658187 RepID=G9EU31_9GAMM|nr:hypothetical protein LDG_8821 [Legionella drancourtii LLAP12]
MFTAILDAKFSKNILYIRYLEGKNFSTKIETIPINSK